MSVPIDPISQSVIAAKTIFELLGSVARPIVEKLIEKKIILNKGVTIYHKSSEIEYAFMLSLGEQSSRLDTIIKKLSGFLTKSVDFPNIIEVSGYGLQHSENLVELGMMSLEKNRATIDFGRIIRNVRSETVFLKIRQNLPDYMRRIMVVGRLSKTARYIGEDFMEDDIEISLDYADLWHKVLDQYTVRDIEIDFGLIIDTPFIVSRIPKPYRDKIIRAAKAISGGNQDAVKFLKLLTESFTSFDKPERIEQLRNTISVIPHDLIKITSVTPRMQTMEIADVGYPVVLPESLRITLAVRLEGHNFTLTGKLVVDLKKFGKIISDVVAEMDKKTKRLKV
ncbi:MAG TPA: hypothetical protein VJR22_08305 [Candidatus Nitrosotalea sp.]|nr:hypothetical protein [Candidatus Nitrosotalea sp.]